MRELYISTDIETDGPIPGQNSMLSFGSAAFDVDRKLLGTFQANLELLPEATPNPDTMNWWKTQPEAWKACRQNLMSPHEALGRYVQWIEGLKGKPVFVAYPAGFDFLFMYWYLMRFLGRSPFSFSAVDVKTAAMMQMKCDYREATKKNMPKRWFSSRPHTHVALDDAIEQGELFINILRESRGLPPVT